MGRFLISFAVLAAALSAAASPVTIRSSHTAQLIYPDEELTISLEVVSPEVESLRIRILNDAGTVEREYDLPLTDRFAEDVIEDLDVGLHLYHIHRSSQSMSQPISESTPLSFTRIAVVPRPDPTITAETSPIGVDAWLSWRFRGDLRSVERAAELMRRMGIHWVRDRFSWAEAQPAPDAWEIEWYDLVYRAQAEEGLQVVPVFHDVAPWASPAREMEPAHRPNDLEALTAMTRRMAEDWGDVIAGVEIGNEINSPIFFRGGSHGAAAYLKAAATGLAQGDPDLWRLLSSTTDALPQPPGQADAEGLVANDVLEFVDAVSPHHYGPLHGLSQHVNWWQQHAMWNSVWMTEMGSTAVPEVGPWVGDEERTQAAYLREAYDQGLEAGADRIFYFCLMDFFEHGERPFGLVEAHGQHWVPRLGLVALAELAATIRGNGVHQTAYEAGELPARWLSLDEEAATLTVQESGSAVIPQEDWGIRFERTVHTAHGTITAESMTLVDPLNSAEWPLSVSDAFARTATVENWGPLWSTVPVTERLTWTLFARLRFGSFVVTQDMDRVTLERVLTPPIVFDRPRLMPVFDARLLTETRLPVTNTTEATREVTVTWLNGDAPPTPLRTSEVSLRMGPGETGWATFQATNFLHPEEIANETGVLTWRSEGQMASGEATPQWDGIQHRGERAIRIDGSGEDWEGVPRWVIDATHTVVGLPPEVDHASLQMLWDEEALWLFAKIDDEWSWSPNPVEQPWAGDALELFFDLNPDHLDAGMNERVFQLIATPSGIPQLPNGSVTFSRPDGASTEAIESGFPRWAGTTTANPPGIELRIPWSVFGLEELPWGERFKFDWAVDDLDPDGPTRSQRVWRGSMENWRDPSGYQLIYLAR